MLRPLLSSLACAILAVPVLAQAPPRFEVASIRPTADQGAGVRVGFQSTGSQVRVAAMSIKDYVGIAYRLRPQQIEGPEWIGRERFDIVATIPDGAPQSQIPEMLQALLVDRFQLKARRETKEFPVYVLGAGRNGAKLIESAPDPKAASTSAGVGVNVSGGGTAGGVSVDLGGGSSFSLGNNQLILRRMTARSMAEVLTRFVDRPVVDQTGLTGTYDVTLDLTPEDYQAMLIRSAVNAGVVLPPQAMRLLETASPDTVSGPLQRLGLTFEARKAPLDVVVVESLSRTPTEN